MGNKNIKFAPTKIMIKLFNFAFNKRVGYLVKVIEQIIQNSYILLLIKR